MCGTDHNTYGNDCIAHCANIVIVSDGACPNCAIKTNSAQPVTSSARQCRCVLTSIHTWHSQHPWRISRCGWVLHDIA